MTTSRSGAPLPLPLPLPLPPCTSTAHRPACPACPACSQCNPYLRPFISLKELLPARVAALVESEFKHRCKQLLALWPESWLLTMLSQPWEGDITMVLPSSGAGAGRGRRTDGHRAAS